MSATWEEYLGKAHKRREEGNRLFHKKGRISIDGAIYMYTDGLWLLNRAEEKLPDDECISNGINNHQSSIRSLQLTMHSNLAECYLTLGMGMKAKEQCDLALTIDEEDDTVHERLSHANRLCKYYDEVLAQVDEKLDRLHSAKDSVDFTAMVDITRELSEFSRIGSGKLDSHLKVKIILERAEIEIILAKALWKDNYSQLPNKISSASATSHLDRCVDLCREAYALTRPFLTDSGTGFDVSDTSDNGHEACFLPYILHAEMNYKRSRALMIKEMIRSQINLSTYIPKIKSWSDDDRASFYNRLAVTRMLLLEGVDLLQFSSNYCETRHDLHGRMLRCKVESLLRLVVVEWIGMNMEGMNEYVKSLRTTFEAVTLKKIDGDQVNKMCEVVSNTSRKLFDGSAEAVHFSMMSTLLSACIHGYNVAGNSEMEIEMLRTLIRARRRCWISQPLPKYTPRSDEDAEDDKSNILSLVEALKQTGREVDLKCPICMESLLGVEGAVVNPLSCDHMFHNHCCQQYCGSKTSTEDMAQALLGHRIIKQMPCPVCRQQKLMRVMRDGSFIEEV